MTTNPILRSGVAAPSYQEPLERATQSCIGRFIEWISPDMSRSTHSDTAFRVDRASQALATAYNDRYSQRRLFSGFWP